MLCLTRKLDEQIIIGDGIIITVVRLANDKVTLGVKAPKSVPVHRMEVYEVIHGREATEETEEGRTENAEPGRTDDDRGSVPDTES